MTLKNLLFYMFYALLLVVVYLLPARVGYHVTQANRAAKALQKEVAQLQLDNSRLEIAYTNLSSPSAVAAMTAKFLPDMRPTTESQFVSKDWFFENHLVYNTDDSRVALDGGNLSGDKGAGGGNQQPNQ